MRRQRRQRAALVPGHMGAGAAARLPLLRCPDGVAAAATAPPPQQRRQRWTLARRMATRRMQRRIRPLWSRLQRSRASGNRSLLCRHPNLALCCSCCDSPLSDEWDVCGCCDALSAPGLWVPVLLFARARRVHALCPAVAVTHGVILLCVAFHRPTRYRDECARGAAAAATMTSQHRQYAADATAATPSAAYASTLAPRAQL